MIVLLTTPHTGASKAAPPATGHVILTGESLAFGDGRIDDDLLAGSNGSGEGVS